MRLLDAVRRGKVTSPTQRKFDPKVWERAVSELSDDLADSTLGVVGLWFWLVLAELRTEGESSLWKAPWAKSARWFVGVTNRDYVVAMARSIEAARAGGSVHMNAFEPRYQAHPNALVGVSLVDAIENQVDLLDANLRTLKSGEAEGEPAFDLAEFHRIRVISSRYLEAERTFQDIVWLGSRLRSVKGRFFIEPRDGDEEQAWEASIIRDQSLAIEITMRGRELWKRSPSFRSLWRETVGARPLFIARKVDGVAVVEMRRLMKTTPDEPPRGNPLRGYAVYEYRELIDEPLPGVGGLPLRTILTIHDTLGLIAEVLWTQLPHDTGIIDEEQINRFAPLVDLAAVESAISAATSIALEDVRRVLDRLYWRPSTILGTTWYRPIVRIGENLGVPIFLPLIASAPRRVIEWWLREGKLDLGLRGRLFERTLIESLKRAMEDRPMRNGVFIDSPGKVESTDGSWEEIDLVIRVGPLLVIGELKFNNQPDTAVDRSNYVGELHDAAAQVARKAEWVRAHLAELESQFAIASSVPLDGRVVPIVVTNCSIGAGLQVDGIPVLDEILLNWYLSRPYAEVAELRRDGSTASRVGPPAYTTLAEMADGFASFARYPPPFARFHTLLEPTPIPVPIATHTPVYAIRYLQREGPVIGPGQMAFAKQPRR